MPWGLWGLSSSKIQFLDLLTTLSNMAISKFWFDVFGEMVGVGGGLVALQSLLTIKRGTSSFQFPFEWAFFEVSTTTKGHLKTSIRWISGKYGEWRGVSTLRSLWILKEAVEPLVSNPKSPLWSLYSHAFYVNLTCPQGITYNSCSEGCGGLSSSKI